MYRFIGYFEVNTFSAYNIGQRIRFQGFDTTEY